MKLRITLQKLFKASLFLFFVNCCLLQFTFGVTLKLILTEIFYFVILVTQKLGGVGRKNSCKRLNPVSISPALFL